MTNLHEPNCDDLQALEQRFKAALVEFDRHYNFRFDEAEKAVILASSNAEKSMLKAEIATEKRFDSVNEFRRTLADQAIGFLSRSEFIGEHKALSQRLDALDREMRTRLDVSSGSTKGMAVMWGIIIAVIATLGSIVTTVSVLTHLR